MELAILLNLMIHYGSNGGLVPSGHGRYCIGSRVIARRLQYLLTLLSVSHTYKPRWLYRLKIYISKAVLVVNDVQPSHWNRDYNKERTIIPLKKRQWMMNNARAL